MRHMGNSGKFAVISGIVAAGLLVLTGMTLAEPVFVAFLGVLALAYLSAVGEVLVRKRRLVLLTAGAGTSLSLGFTLAFLSTWELAFDGQRSFVGTPLPTDDPDNYFVGAAASLAATFLVLFLGAAWPAGRRLSTPVRGQAPARRPSSTRAAATQPAGKGAAPRNTATKGTAAKGSAARRGGTGASPRVPPATRRPSSSSAPVRGAGGRPGAGSAPRR